MSGGHNHNHRDLVAWQEGLDLVDEVYRATSRFPADERFGLVSQMRRSAISIPANIAEGAGRGSPRELLQFLFIARGSLCELETLLIASKRANYLSREVFASVSSRVASVSTLLNGLINYARSRCKT